MLYSKVTLAVISRKNWHVFFYQVTHRLSGFEPHSHSVIGSKTRNCLFSPLESSRNFSLRSKNQNA